MLCRAIVEGVVGQSMSAYWSAEECVQYEGLRFRLPSLQTLYTYPESFRAYKVLIAAQYSGAELTVVSEPPDFQLGKTNRSEEFLAKFPLGKVGIAQCVHNCSSFDLCCAVLQVPAFETAEGVPIYESNAIAHYGEF